MKKRLEAELISIAHRVLKLKNKSEIDQLYLETRKLYEALSVLKFVQDNIDVIKPKIDVNDVEQKLENVLDSDTNQEPIPVIENKVYQEVNQETEPELTQGFDQNITTKNTEILAVADDEKVKIVADQAIKTDDTLVFETNSEEPIFDKKEKTAIETTAVAEPKPAEMIGFDFEKKETPIEFEKSKQPKVQQISFESLLGHQINEPIFDKKQDVVPTLNESLGKNTSFGLNDKIGFVKHLFDNSDEDFNRVVSQIGTFDTFAEAQNFVNNLVKPDYNNWENKEEYEKRFMEIIERKFV